MNESGGWRRKFAETTDFLVEKEGWPGYLVFILGFWLGLTVAYPLFLLGAAILCPIFPRIVPEYLRGRMLILRLLGGAVAVFIYGCTYALFVFFHSVHGGDFGIRTLRGRAMQAANERKQRTGKG